MVKVLVLMSTYNGALYLSEQIASILSQENVEVHLLIRDDGSTDTTKQIIKQYALNYHNITYILGNNIGCTESYKSLLFEAHSQIQLYDYFAFADQDDVWMKDKLHTGIHHLSRLDSNKPSMYCSNLTLVDQDLNIIRDMYITPPSIPTKPTQSLIYNIATGCTIVINKKVIELFYKHTPRVMRMHDSWIYQSCLYLGNVFYDEQAYILYRQHGKNVEGWSISFTKKLYAKLRNFNKFHNKGIDVIANELIIQYADYLTKQDKDNLTVIAKYKINILNKLNLLSKAHSIGLKRNNLFYNIILNFRILLGRL